MSTTQNQHARTVITSKLEPAAVKLVEKWQALIESKDYPNVSGDYNKYVMATMLENQARALKESNVSSPSMAGYDTILMGVARRAFPTLVAPELAAIQPMTAPNGFLFSIVPTYGDHTGPTALFDEAKVGYAGQAESAGSNPYDTANFATYTTGTPSTTAQAEAATSFAQMGFKMARKGVVAKALQIASSVSLEVAEDMRSLHNIDANAEMVTILANELAQETDRHVVRTMYKTALVGAQWTTVPGTIDATVDLMATATYESLALSLIDAIDREANKVATDTRIGKGNFVIVTPRIATIIGIGVLSAFSNELRADTSFRFNDSTRVHFLGTLPSGVAVYVDSFIDDTTNAGFTVGFRARDNNLNAGLIFMPYVPATSYQAINPTDFTPSYGIRSRFGLAASAWVPEASDGQANSNPFFRRVTVTNL